MKDHRKTIIPFLVIGLAYLGYLSTLFINESLYSEIISAVSLLEPEVKELLKLSAMVFCLGIAWIASLILNRPPRKPRK